MDKLEQLLHMAEHPEQYTDEQIENLLADEEARTYYELMATARSGFEYRKGSLAAHNTEPSSPQHPTPNTQHPSPSTPHPAAVTPLAPQPEPQQVLFEDAELQTILQQVGEYYQKKVVFSNDSTRHIRLYIKWNQAESANEMIERLNNFEKVNIKLDGNNIISE